MSEASAPASVRDAGADGGANRDAVAGRSDTEAVHQVRDDPAVDEIVPADPEEAEAPLDLARICWSLTTVAFLIAMVILGLRGDIGYAGVTLAVAIAAAINLF